MIEKVSLNEITINARVNFFNLLKKTWNEATTYSNKFTDDDARSAFFSLVSESNLWLLINFDTFLEMLDVNDKKISKYMSLNPKSRIAYLTQHDTITRISYVAKTMWDIEVLIKDIMIGLQNPPKGKYYEFTKDFLKHLNMYDEQRFKILNAPYQIRNSLHNNGYAYHDFEIVLRGQKFEFKKGAPLKFTGWGNLYIFFDELLDVLIEIIKNPLIEKISRISHTNIPEEE